MFITISTPATRPPATKLSSVEALRGVAAVAVVLSHTARHVNKAYSAPGLITLFQSGHAGVDLFFVISGFIILYVHHPDVGHSGRLGHYLGRRFSRVMPLYWVALLVTIGLGAAGSHVIPSAPVLAWSAFLLPSMSEPILGIAWTLQYEVVFYLVFAILIANRRAGIALIAAWFVWIAATAMGLRSSQVPLELCGPYCLEFLMGMAAAQLVFSGRVGRPFTVAVAGAVWFLTMMVLESLSVFDGFVESARLVYGPAAALLIAGLASAERAGRVRVPVWLQILGGASYSIYLFQFVFIGSVWQGWIKAGLSDPGTNALCFFVLSAAAVFGGIIVSRWVEKPVLSQIRGRQPAPILRAAQ